MDIAPFGKMVPQTVRELVLEAKTNLTYGRYDVFDVAHHGPIKDQAGKVRLASGRMSDKAMLSMNFFVQGVVGKVPK